MSVDETSGYTNVSSLAECFTVNSTNIRYSQTFTLDSLDTIGYHIVTAIENGSTSASLKTF